MKKIILLAQQLDAGGVEKAICLLANMLSKQNYKVEIFSFLKSKRIIPLDEKVKVHVMSFLVSDKYIKHNFLYKFFRMILTNILLVCVIIFNTADVVVSTRHEYSTKLSFFSIRKRLNIAQLHHDHNFDTALIHDFNYKYSKIDYLVHLTEISRNEIQNLMKHNLYTKNITIPNFLPYREVKTLTKKNYVIAVGRFCHDKGFERLIEIWCEVISSHKNWILMLIGDGDLKPLYEEKIKNLGISEYVHMPGFLSNDEIYEYLTISKIYAMTSVREAFSISMIEAMQCKLPIVAFNARLGPLELVHDSINGFLVNNGNIYEFCNALKKLMTNDELCTRLGNNAYRFSEKFSEENVLRSWVDIIL